ncbi:MAG: hypothetical protein IPM98_07770 [Lewinellaceae bacterium]|nr:hypothetical protein [Lewinellaceae bacterium]
MNNRVLLAALAGGVAFFLLGWLVWGILLMDMMRDMNPQLEGVEKNPPDMLLIFLSSLVSGLFTALLFSRWAGINTFMGGLIAGAWVFGLISLSFDLMFLATTNVVSPGGAVLDVVANVAVGALVGGVVGWALGYKRAG